MTEPAFLDDARTFYNAIATDYAEMFKTVLDDQPLDRAMLDAFAGRVCEDGGGPVLDVGSGPGRVSAYLHARGVEVSGIDLSVSMVELARSTFPALRFDEASMTALPHADGSLAGLLSWYTLIHVPPSAHPGVLAEFHRVLRPGGQLLLGFQIGSEPSRVTDPWGYDVSLDFHRLSPDGMTDLLRRSGFTVDARMVREPAGQEKTRQAQLLARKG
ncbi:class I SAM-dependent methyltransferase [Streptomyces sp. NPDC051940]|uniref:class I SAM-dependent methyltransferase n=1 Tax=Streptomyces sp. NPDC051940 TaxID=3155675 RepID=UPI003416D9AA